MWGARLATVLGRRRPWSPSVLYPVLWFDAQRGATITDAGAGAISAWANRGSGGDAAQASGAARPTYAASSLIGGYPAARFAAAQYVSGTATIAGTTMTAFAVCTLNTATTPSAGRLISISDTSVADITSAVGMSVLERNLATANTRTRFNAASSALNAITTQVPFLYAAKKDATQIHTSLNGAAFDDVAVTGTLASTRFVLGGAVAAGDTVAAGTRWGGDLGEAILLTTAASQADCDRVAGYLAWKWGQQSLLSDAHPYKNEPPYA